MLRLLAMLGGLAGAGTLSQFPEFSQQYLQRLGGQLDALTAVTTDFDASATTSGLTRDAALAALSGSAFLDLRRADMTRVFARQATVAADYALLSAAAPLERLALPHRFRDTETLNATWADFRPAVPVSTTGIAAAGIGFGAGWLGLSMLFGLFLKPFRRRAA